MSEDVTINDQREYEVVDNQAVRLTIVIGDAQVGGSSLVLDSTPVKTGPNGQVLDIAIGAGDEIRYKTLECTTTVRDINPSTNKTSVTYMFRGGKVDQDFPYSVEVRTEGGYARYFINFLFV